MRLRFAPGAPTRPDERCKDGNDEGGHRRPPERREHGRLIGARNLPNRCRDHERNHGDRQDHPPAAKPHVHVLPARRDKPCLNQKQDHPCREHDPVEQHQGVEHRVGTGIENKATKVEAWREADQNHRDHEDRHAGVEAPFRIGARDCVAGHDVPLVERKMILYGTGPASEACPVPANSATGIPVSYAKGCSGFDHQRPTYRPPLSSPNRIY